MKFLFKKVKIIVYNHSPIYNVFNILDIAVTSNTLKVDMKSVVLRCKLQGPASFKDHPLVTIYYENVDNENLYIKISPRLLGIQSGHPSDVFKNKNIIPSQ